MLRSYFKMILEPPPPQSFLCSFFVCLISLCLRLSGMDKDLTSAKALYQQIQDEGLQINELSLKRLALLYKNAGEAVPFEEPPVNITRHSMSFLH